MNGKYIHYAVLFLGKVSFEFYRVPRYIITYHQGVKSFKLQSSICYSTLLKYFFLQLYFIFFFS